MHADASLFDPRFTAALRGTKRSGERSSATRVQPGAHADGGAAGGRSGGVPDRLSIAFAADADAPQRARAAASHALGHWSQDRRDIALLVISELVTNAVRHGARDDSDEIALLVRRRGRATRIEVTDPRARDGAVADSGVGEEAQRSGWGLPIVAELTDRWGVEGGPGRTCVWCELDDL